MSQEKVNKYKEQKANRKKEVKKEKTTRILTSFIGAVVGIALVAWIGYSAYDMIATDIASAKTEVELSAITDYITDLTATESVAE